MRIEFDPVKDASNQDKHGLSLALASALDWDEALVWVDERHAYGELRMMALAPRPASCIAWRLWIVVIPQDRQFAQSQST